MDTVKVRLTIAYDGAAYAGWQTQPSGVGVQQRMEETLARYFPSKPRLHSSSRTDTGVHALGMVAHFAVPKPELKMSSGKLVLALNAALPEDIRVMEAVRCRADFHARFQATGKQYRYYVWNHRAMSPLHRHQAWHIPLPLDLKAMRAAAKRFVGTHDFQSFAAHHPYKKRTTVRTLTRCDVQKRGPLVTFIIEGDGFLYKMCRGIVGTLVQLGRGRFTVDDIDRILACKDRRAAGMSAPAHGLVLWKVFYKKGKPANGAQDLSPDADEACE